MLMQSRGPIAYASRALTETEKQYAQIEKEMLAIVYAMEKFHTYTYGRDSTIESDHKPLVTIHKKPLQSAPKRLQRMLMRLQKYSIDIQYRPGKELYLADTLSRAYLAYDVDANKTESMQQQSDWEKELEQVNMISHLLVASTTLQTIQNATQEDQSLQELQQYIIQGWPDTKYGLPSYITPYYDIRDELTVQQGMVLKGNTLVVPQAARKFALERIHSSHMGANACIRRAREALYWPGMTSHIRNHVQKCSICRDYDNKQQKEPLLAHEVPPRPWAKVGADLFKFKGRDYLIVTDYYSNFWEIDRLQATTSDDVIRKMKQHFSRYGIPEVLISDNGTQFTSREFRSFTKQWEIQHETSSPHHHQSNGKAENSVKTAKRLMKKALQAGTDPWLAILEFRNTPAEGLNTSPAQRLMNRKTRTLLPTIEQFLPEKMEEHHNIMERKKRQAKYYNMKARDLPELKTNDVVRIQPTGRDTVWKPAKIEKVLPNRSYLVITPGGTTYRRNRVQLRKTKEEFKPSAGMDDPPVEMIPQPRQKKQTSIPTPVTKKTVPPQAQANESGENKQERL